VRAAFAATRQAHRCHRLAEQLLFVPISELAETSVYRELSQALSRGAGDVCRSYRGEQPFWPFFVPKCALQTGASPATESPRECPPLLSYRACIETFLKQSTFFFDQHFSTPPFSTVFSWLPARRFPAETSP